MSILDISVIIVNWNTRDLLRECLRSIGEQTHRPHEVIVIDNASSDGSVDMVASEFPSTVLIRNEGNRGFAAANNQGLKIAKGRYVLLLNPDTIILDRAIDTMIGWCDAQPNVGVAGCQVWENDTKIQRTCFADQGPLNIFLVETGLYWALSGWRFFGGPHYSSWDRKTEREVNIVSGVFMLVPMPVLDHVGLLDEAFFIYSEEADWCMRMRIAGYRCVFTPVARIIHRDGGGKSTSQIKARMYVQMQKSKLIFVRKYYGRGGYIAARATLLACMLLRCLIFATISRSNGSSKAHLAWAATLFHLKGVEPT